MGKAASIVWSAARLDPILDRLAAAHLVLRAGNQLLLGTGITLSCSPLLHFLHVRFFCSAYHKINVNG